MSRNNIIWLTCCCLMAACADNEMTSLTVSEPDSLARTDYLKDYAPLKSYTTMNVGTAVDGSIYDQHDLTYRALCENFSEVQPQRLFTHASLMTASGTLDTETATGFLDNAAASGHKVLAGPLCTHQMQNADYLNNLIKPDVLSLDGSPLTSRCIVATNTVVSDDAKSQQFEFAFTKTPGVKPNLEYEFMFYVRGSRNGSFTMSVPGGSDFSPKVNVTQEWKKVRAHVVMAQGIYNLRSVLFNIGTYAGTLYIDNLELYEIDEYGDRSKNKLKDNANLDDEDATATGLTLVDGSSDGITQLAVSEAGDGYDPNTYTVDKTAEEKARILTAALTDYVTSVVSLYKGKVAAWDVVAQPFTTDDDANSFQWQDYLGRDYAVMAFRQARTAGAGNLVITELGMESDIDKCRKLIDYIDYIEQQGGKVDGINAIISTDSYSQSELAGMLRLLAATGKMVRLSEIEARTADGYADIIRTYIQTVPAPQRYGISLKSFSPLWNDEKNRTEIYGAIADAIRQ